MSGDRAWVERLRPWVAPACRWAVGLVFLAAGLAKLLTLEPELVRAEIMTLVPVSDAVAGVVARLLPLLEIALGAWLLVDRPRRLAAWVAAGALILFTVLLLRAAWSGAAPEGCMCFGAVSSGSIHLDIARNLLLTALAARAGV